MPHIAVLHRYRLGCPPCGESTGPPSITVPSSPSAALCAKVHTICPRAAAGRSPGRLLSRNASAGSLAAVEVMPRAELVLVGQCGHWLPIEAPEIFSSEVTAFLQRLH